MKAVRAGGASIWLQYPEWDLTASGQLIKLVESFPLDGLVLSPLQNIFEAPVESRGQREMRRLSQLGLRAEEILYRYEVQRIRELVELLLPAYEQSNGVRGLLSIPILPICERRPAGLISAMDELWQTINRPNLVLALPCTAQGIQAFEQGLQQGYNLEIRSVLALQDFHQVRQVHRTALSQLAARGQAVNHITAVAAIDLNMIDQVVGRHLGKIAAAEGIQAERAEWLQGKAAMAIADLIMAQQEVDLGSGTTLPEASRPLRLRWDEFESVDRSPLESTIERLLGPDTIFTLNHEQISRFEGSKLSVQSRTRDMSVSRGQVEAIENLGIDVAAILYAERERIAAADLKRYEAGLQEAQTWVAGYRAELGSIQNQVADTLRHIDTKDVNRRIWEGDRTGSPERLSWLELPQVMGRYVQELTSEGVQALTEGRFETLLLVGSASQTYLQQLIASLQPSSPGLELKLLNCLDPIECRKKLSGLKPEKTLAVILDWERDEIETYYLFSYLLDWFGSQDDIEPGEHLAAVTNPGSELADIAESLGFRAVYSHETVSGLVYGPLNTETVLPATLAGINLTQVLSGEREMLRRCSVSTMIEDHPGLQLAVILASLHTAGRNKLTILFDPEAIPLSTWLAEQLDIGLRGMPTPWTIIAGEPSGSGQVYDQSRGLIYLRTNGELDKKRNSWVEAGIPVLVYQLDWREEELGRTILLWQYATAAALQLLELTPNVRTAEFDPRRTVHSLLKSWNRKSGFEDTTPLPGQLQVSIVGESAVIDPKDPASERFWAQILKTLPPDGGLRLNFFLHLPAGIRKKLRRIQRIMRDRYSLWCTIDQGRLRAHGEEAGDTSTFEVIVSVRETRDLMGPSMAVSLNTVQRAAARAAQRDASRAGHSVIHLELQDDQALRPLVETLARALDQGLDAAAQSVDSE